MKPKLPLIELPNGTRARLRSLASNEVIPVGAFCSIGSSSGRVKDINPTSVGKRPEDFTGWVFFVR